MGEVLEPRLATSQLGRLKAKDGQKLLKSLEEQGKANVFHYNALLNAFAKESNWRGALASLATMTVQKDSISFNACIRALAMKKRWEKALALLDNMEREAVRSDTISFNSAMSAIGPHQWPVALQLLDVMQRRSVQRSTVTLNTALSVAPECTEELLRDMEEGRLEKDVISFSSAIRVTGDWRRAMALLEDMEDQHVELNWICRNAAIAACAEGQAWEAALHLKPTEVIGFNSAITACGNEWTVALALMSSMRQRELQLDVITFNAAITACDEAKNWARSFELFQEMQSLKLKANTRSYAAVIHSCAICGFLWPSALHLLAEMASKDVEMNTMTRNSAISACEKGSAWSCAMQLFDDLEQPSVVSYGACAKALEQAGRWMEVLDLMVKMLLDSLPPDVVTSSAAISALAKGHVWSEAMEIFEEMLDYELVPWKFRKQETCDEHSPKSTKRALRHVIGHPQAI